MEVRAAMPFFLVHIEVDLLLLEAVEPSRNRNCTSCRSGRLIMSIMAKSFYNEEMTSTWFKSLAPWLDASREIYTGAVHAIAYAISLQHAEFAK